MANISCKYFKATIYKNYQSLPLIVFYYENKAYCSTSNLSYYKWNKEFVEAGKARLDGDTHRTKNVFKKITAFIEKFKGIGGTLLCNPRIWKNI
jgi:hypothetical protein